MKPKDITIPASVKSIGKGVASYYYDGTGLERVYLEEIEGWYYGTYSANTKLSAEKGKPLLCINAGKLAYLACLESDELEFLSKVVKGEYITEKRMMLSVSVVENGKEARTHFNV